MDKNEIKKKRKKKKGEGEKMGTKTSVDLVSRKKFSKNLYSRRIVDVIRRIKMK